MKPQILYKIRDVNQPGLWSKGGADAEFSKYAWGKKGKTWTGEGPVRLHLNMYAAKQYYRKAAIPENWEVVMVGFTSEDGSVPDGYEHGKAFNARDFYYRRHLDVQPT